MAALAPREPAPIAVVLVTHESAAVIGRCLAALADIPALEVVVVDNASTDATASLVRAARRELVVLERNRGFAAAANIGARHARAARLCFLNPDCLLTASAVALARAAWAENPDAVLVPDFRQGDMRVPGRQPGYSRAKLLTDLLEGRAVLPRVRARLMRRATYHDRRWWWPLGTCLFIPREVFAGVGGFDERYFLYMEDCELGAALHASGVAIESLPVALDHVGCGSSAISDGRRLALLETARLRFAAAHYGRPTAWAFQAVLHAARFRTTLRPRAARDGR
jgi:GT2 family glycosyltransferase